MSKELMAECLEEARVLLEAQEGEQGYDESTKRIVTYSHALIAAALYAERCALAREQIGIQAEPNLARYVPMLPSTATIQNPIGISTSLEGRRLT